MCKNIRRCICGQMQGNNVETGLLWGLKDKFATIKNFRGIVEYALCKGNYQMVMKPDIQ